MLFVLLSTETLPAKVPLPTSAAVGEPKTHCFWITDGFGFSALHKQSIPWQLAWSHFTVGKMVLQPNTAFCLPRCVCGHAAIEQFQAFPWVCTDLASDYSPDYGSPSFPLHHEYGVTPHIFWCFFFGRKHCKSLSLDIPVSRNVSALGVLISVNINRFFYKGLKK